MQLYKKGRRVLLQHGVHHDNFDCGTRSISRDGTPWRRDRKKDIVGLFGKEPVTGMKFAVSEHWAQL